MSPQSHQTCHHQDRFLYVPQSNHKQILLWLYIIELMRHHTTGRYTSRVIITLDGIQRVIFTLDDCITVCCIFCINFWPKWDLFLQHSSFYDPSVMAARKHYRLEHTDKPFTCFTCKSIFDDESELHQHLVILVQGRAQMTSRKKCLRLREIVFGDVTFLFLELVVELLTL